MATENKNKKILNTKVLAQIIKQLEHIMQWNVVLNECITIWLIIDQELSKKWQIFWVTEVTEEEMKKRAFSDRQNQKT